MTADRSETEQLLRELAPQVLGAVVRRHGDFADAEDAVQEALLTASQRWPSEGLPDNPAGWLVRVASRRMIDTYRREDARRRREDLAASWSIHPPAPPPPGEDDTLTLMFLCCHPTLTPASAIALTLRAVGGLTTREIASAFLVPEPTMAQRISRAKARLKATDGPFALPSHDERPARLRSVLHALYLMFNEAYTTSEGPELVRADLAAEAIRLTRVLQRSLPEDPEVTGLLALMLLTDARRPARADEDGHLVPLDQQDRSRWDRAMIGEGLRLVSVALRHGQVGEYQLQAAIAAVHGQADRYEDTDWGRLLTLYDLLERMSGNPMVALNRAIALAMAESPRAGLDALDPLHDKLGDHHRFHAVRAHLLERTGQRELAVEAYRTAAERTRNAREQHYLTTQAARLASSS